MKAARRAHVARSTVIAWEAADPTFRQAVAQAKQEALGERLAGRYHANPSLQNLIALLAVLRPEKYAGVESRIARPTPRTPAAPTEAVLVASARSSDLKSRKTGEIVFDEVVLSDYNWAMLIRLREHRKARELSVRQLAALAGVGFATVHRIEVGRISPTVAMLEKLAKALGISVRDFFPERDLRPMTKRKPRSTRRRA